MREGRTSRRGLFAAAASVGAGARAAAAQPLRLGLIGCGGRGTGAAAQALRADANTTLVAMADAFVDRLEASLASLTRDPTVAARVQVQPASRFVGFEAYEGVLKAGVDVVILATPPHFRPLHFEAAVAAGTHVFAEKPVAVDAPGVRRVLAAAQVAKQKRLSVVSGFCFRYDPRMREAIRRVHAGAIGPLRAVIAHDFRGPVWLKARQKGWTDMEWQMRNWYYFRWLSGDFNVEQHVHLLDQCAWVLRQYPIAACGSGGRAQRTRPEHGDIYDHHTVMYELASGLKVMSTCRQHSGAHNGTTIHLLGAHGEAVLSEKRVTITGRRRAWEAPESPVDKFQAEHDALFASIRQGQPVNDGEYMAKSTLMAIMGRMATYTGQLVTWDQAMSAEEELRPAAYDWQAAPPPVLVAVPGAA